MFYNLINFEIHEAITTTNAINICITSKSFLMTALFIYLFGYLFILLL
jgi:positive regulator of sigma E activity